ncbi:ROK family protein [Kineococcus sp. TBRC 1896]|uniref:ROK family protein n=1 Tax=Kineococcus mangrovi TaxID=1660183 RepID=A0ABV4I5V5_9ACTN
MPQDPTPCRPAAPIGAPGRSFGVDVGGTTVKGLRLGADGTVRGEHRVRTPAPDPDGRRVAAAVLQVATALGHSPGEPLGVALPGVVDERAGRAVRSANLGWADVPFTGLLPPGTTLCHDVRAGAVAEARSGAARRAEGVVAFVPVGTGIAAAVLLDGIALVAGGFAGEIGQLVLTDGPFRGLRTEEVASAARRAGCEGARDAAAAPGAALLAADARTAAVAS